MLPERNVDGRLAQCEIGRGRDDVEDIEIVSVPSRASCCPMWKLIGSDTGLGRSAPGSSWSAAVPYWLSSFKSRSAVQFSAVAGVVEPFEL